MDAEQVKSMKWFEELKAEVELAVQARRAGQSGQSVHLEAELGALRSQLRGWAQSLGKADLDGSVRTMLEASIRDASSRISEIEALQSERAAEHDAVERVVDAAQIALRLGRLANVLGSHNPTLGNLELAHHIDRIVCYPDGRVILRKCRLGALAGAVDLLSAQPCAPRAADQPPGGIAPVNPRRRARLRVYGENAAGDDLQASAEWITDPNRFAELDDRWFEEREFHVPQKRSWAEENAAEVAEYRLQNRASMEATARHFGKTVPTIQAALRYAKELNNVDAFGTEISRPSRPHWARDHAVEVAAFLREPGRKLKDAVAHFGKSEPTLRKALNFANRADDEARAGGSPLFLAGDEEPIDGNAVPAA